MENHYEYSARSPRGVEVKLDFSALPQGFIVDESAHRLSWTPGFEDANDPADPKVTSRTIPVLVKAWEIDRPEVILERRTVIWVTDTLREIKIPNINHWESYELKPFTQTIKVESVDFPEGPFVVSLDGAPAGVQIKSTSDPKFFQISLLSTEDEVTITNKTSSDFYSFYKDFTVYLRVKAPRGEAIATFPWKVRDVRNSPEILVPKTMEQGLDVMFPVTAIDTNHEVPPQVRLYYGVPFGTVTLVAIS